VTIDQCPQFERSHPKYTAGSIPLIAILAVKIKDKPNKLAFKQYDAYTGLLSAKPVQVFVWLLLKNRVGQFGAAVSAVDVSAMKCEVCFALECQQSAKVRTASSGKRVSATVSLALVLVLFQLCCIYCDP